MVPINHSTSIEDLNRSSTSVEIKCQVKREPSTSTINYAEMTDEEILSLVESGKLPAYRLEQDLKDTVRAVNIRRQMIGIPIISFIRLIFVTRKGIEKRRPTIEYIALRILRLRQNLRCLLRKRHRVSF